MADDDRQKIKLVYRLHAVERMFERNISEDNVNKIIFGGKVIEKYPDDLPYPSRLILGFIGNRPIHIVIADNKIENQIIVITVYEPSNLKWDESFERRIK